ncbi:shufflon system plasmid conjugative transfer pilus tip adhesin PilV, partial [Klebsiella pneumoniae]
NGGKNSLNRLIRCVCGKKIGPDPRNFNQRVSLGRNDLLIRTFPNYIHSNGNIDADGRLNAGEFLYINGKANVGANCSPNGLQGTDSTGLLLSCVGGKWTKASGGGGGLYSTNTKDGNSATCSTPNTDTNACSCPSGKTSVVIMSSISTSVTIRPDNGQGVTTKSTQRLYQCR